MKMLVVLWRWTFCAERPGRELFCNDGGADTPLCASKDGKTFAIFIHPRYMRIQRELRPMDSALPVTSRLTVLN